MIRQENSGALLETGVTALQEYKTKKRTLEGLNKIDNIDERILKIESEISMFEDRIETKLNRLLDLLDTKKGT